MYLNKQSKSFFSGIKIKFALALVWACLILIPSFSFASSLLDNIHSYHGLNNTLISGTGSASASNTNALFQVGGKDGYAIYFNSASSSKISTTGYATIFDVDYTVNFWTYYSSTQGTKNLMSIRNTSDSFQSINVTTDSANKLYLAVMDGVSGNTCSGSVNLPITSNAWQMVTVQYNHTTQRLNLSIASSTGISSLDVSLCYKTTGNSPNVVNFGGNYYDAAGYYFTGYIDEVGVWSKFLSSSEISSLFASGSAFTYPFYGSGGGSTYLGEFITVTEPIGSMGSSTVVYLNNVEIPIDFSYYAVASSSGHLVFFNGDTGALVSTKYFYGNSSGITHIQATGTLPQTGSLQNYSVIISVVDASGGSGTSFSTTTSLSVIGNQAVATNTDEMIWISTPIATSTDNLISGLNLLSFLNVPALLHTKVPFAYMFDVYDSISGAIYSHSSTTFSKVTFDIKLNSSLATTTVDFFSRDTIMVYFSQDWIDIFRALEVMFLWSLVGAYLFNDVRNRNFI